MQCLQQRLRCARALGWHTSTRGVRMGGRQLPRKADGVYGPGSPVGRGGIRGSGLGVVRADGKRRRSTSEDKSGQPPSPFRVNSRYSQYRNGVYLVAPAGTKGSPLCRSWNGPHPLGPSGRWHVRGDLHKRDQGARRHRNRRRDREPGKVRDRGSGALGP